jgi:hypothetical protein
MTRKLIALTIVAVGCLWVVGTREARADGRFTFGLNIWGPPPVYVGPPYRYEPYYPPPVIVRRVVVPPPEPVIIEPAPAIVSPAPTARRSRQVDTVLVKIGELHSDDSDVREDAAKWLGDSHDPRAVRPLLEVMQHDRKDDVREECARALGQIGGPDAERGLTITSTNDPDDDVRRTASKALIRMAKQASRRGVH